MIIRFNVPSRGNLLIKGGAEVDFKTPLARSVSEQSVTVNIAQHLGIAPQKIFLTLTKVVGDSLSKGELLAQKKGFLSSRVLTSPYTGIIKEVNHEDGNVVIDIREESDDITFCYFKGQVESVQGQQVSLKVKHAKEYELKTATDNFGGPLRQVVQDELPKLTEEDVSGKVIFIDDLTSYDQSKIEALGARGFLTLKMNNDDVASSVALLNKKITAQELGEEEKNYCIIDKKTCKLYIYQ